jgi:uncharacterized protein
MINAPNTFQGINVTFNTTEDCNLACTYCYEVNKRPRTLSLDKAKKFIDILLNTYDFLDVKGTEVEWMAYQGIVLDFIGGDALMNVDLVEEIVDYWQEAAWKINSPWASRWRISISTNGTLFDKPGVKRFLEKYKRNIHLGISIDGCPEVHDKNRIYKDGSGSMKKIMEDWNYYVKWCAEAGVDPNTKATLNKESIPYLYKSVKFLHEELNLKIINMNFIMEDMDIQKEDLIELDKQLNLVKDYVLEHRHEMYLSMLHKAMGIGEPMKNDPEACKRGKCGAGAMPALGINGKIYPCFRYLPHTSFDNRDDFNVGDVDNGFIRKDRFKLVRSKTREKISDDECKNCPIESMCPYCIGGCYAEFGEFKRTKYICEVAKLQDKYTKLYWREYDKLEGTHTEKAYLQTYEEYIKGESNENN